MATLTNTKIKDTYPALLKADDNGIIGASEKVITDGLGNASVLSIGTASASFSSDVEINSITIGRGSGDLGSNVVLGFNALDSNTTGASNTAIGSTALNANTTGSQNTALGNSALYTNTIGGSNTALGYFALRNNTVSNNTAIGSGALRYNTTGGSNVAIGRDALNSNTTSSNITAIGRSAMANATGGSNNTAVGFYSLVDNQASYNVAIGDYALSVNTTGGYNTAIGSGAGDTTITGIKNIYIGYDAVGSAAHNNNEIVIGSETTGNGSNTATYGNASITEHHFTAGQVNVSGNLAVDTNTLYVDAENNRVGIGTNLPTEDLQLQSVGSSFIYMSSGSVSPASLGMRMGQSISSGAAEAEVSFDVQDDLFQIKTGTAASTRRLTIDKTSGKVDITNDFAVDTNTLYVDAANNRVGVGTSSPDRDLTVIGDAHIGSSNCGITLSDNSGVASIYGLDAAGTTYKPIELRTGAAGTGFYQDTSGNVGIGTSTLNTISGSNPTLTLAGTGITGGLILQNSGTDTARIYETGNLIIHQGMSGIGHSFYVNAVSEAMRIDSSGNVGIGTQTAAGSNGKGLAIYTSDYPRLTFRNSTTGDGATDGTQFVAAGSDFEMYNKEAGALIFGTSNLERMRIDSSGNVGIGAVPTRTLQVHEASATSSAIKISNSTTGATVNDGFDLVVDSVGNAYLAQKEALPLIFLTSDTERMRIASDGSVFIYGISGAASALYDVQWTSGAELVVITSSARYKENINDLPSVLDKVNALRPVSFTEISSQTETVGLIAEEVVEVIPEIVAMKEIEGYDEPQPDGVNYSRIPTYLIKAIQEQQEIINDLKARIETLEAK